MTRQSRPPAGPRETAPLNHWPALLAPDFLPKRKQSKARILLGPFPHSRDQKNQFPGFHSLSGNSKVWKAGKVSLGCPGR